MATAHKDQEPLIPTRVMVFQQPGFFNRAVQELGGFHSNAGHPTEKLGPTAAPGAEGICYFLAGMSLLLPAK